MTTDLEAAFWTDIAEHPDDDSLRLIFADWLTEQGRELESEALRWLVREGKRPYLCRSGASEDFCWDWKLNPLSREFQRAALNESLFHSLDGGRFGHPDMSRNYCEYPTRLAAEQALVQAWVAARNYCEYPTRLAAEQALVQAWVAAYEGGWRP
jgi:uncharacterized protein (TIGR02996 family)